MVVLVSLGVGIGSPAVAIGQGPSSAFGQSGATTSPFTPGVPQAPPTVPTTTATPTVSTTNTNGDSGISGATTIGISIGALIVIGGISFFIWRDARKRAPVRAAAAGGEGRTRAGSKPRAKPRKLSPAERKRRKRGRAR
jgi:hypothetical protein